MKIKLIYKLLTLFLLLTPALISCVTPITPMSAPPNDINVVQSEKCLSPLYGNSFSYPISADNENISYPGLDMFVVPPSPWQIETSLPEFDGLTNWEQRDLGVIQTRQVDNYFEIWIHVSDGLEKQGYLALYRTDTKEWKVVPENIDTLIVDKNGLLWGSYSGYLGYASSMFESNALSKYDEFTNTFIPVENMNNIPAVVEKAGSLFFSRVLLDKEGVFWILVPTDGIYKYDPNSGEVKKVFEFYGQPFRDAEINSKGIIYVLFNNIYYRDGEEQLIYLLKKYDTKTAKKSDISLIYTLEPYPSPFTLLIDSQDRLWLDNIAYIENGSLYQIQRSPLFISPIREAYNDYRYKSASVVLESSDGRMWFEHQNGMISLDPSKGEWCWFTTYQSNIVEDSDHNLWMIADGKLYKNSLEK